MKMDTTIQSILADIRAEVIPLRREIEALGMTTERASAGMRVALAEVSKAFAALGEQIAAINQSTSSAFEDEDTPALVAPNAQSSTRKKGEKTTVLDKINRDMRARLEGLLNDIFQSVEDALVDAIFGERQKLKDLGKTIKNQFKALLEGILRTILDEVREALVEALKRATTPARRSGTSALGSALGSILGGVGDALGGVFGGAAASSGGGFGLGSPTLAVSTHAFAEHGGTVATNQPVLVGEAGPEIFVPPMLGEIIPNDRLGGFGGGETTVVVNYNIDARGAEPGVEQRIRRALQETEKRAVDRAKYEIFNDARRGGVFSRLSRR